MKKFYVLNLGSPLCGNCKTCVNCPCDCHKFPIVSGYHELIQSRKFNFSFYEKIRHIIVTKLKLKVARI